MAVVLNRNDIIQEAYELYTRLILLQQPPFILQEHNEYEVYIEEICETLYSVLYFRDEYESSIVFDIDSLFFLSDGYIVHFLNSDISQAQLYILGDNIRNSNLVSIADTIVIAPIKDKCEQNYVELADLEIYNGKKIKNYSGLSLKFSSGTISELNILNILGTIENIGIGRKSQKLFYFDKLVLDNKKSLDLLERMNLSLNVDTLYITDNQYWDINFKNISVKKIIISDGTIGISFSGLYCSLDVILPKSLKYIGQMSFRHCYLNSINLEDLEDVYIGNASFQSAKFSEDKEKLLDLSKCLYLGVDAFRGSRIKNVIVSNKTVMDSNSFSHSSLESFEVVNIEKQVLYNQKICNDYIISLNDIILEDKLHKLTHYDFSKNTYIINRELFMFCGSLSSIYVPCDKVVFKSRSISFVSLYLKIGGMKEYVIEDVYNTLLCKKWINLDDYVCDYVDEFISKYIGDEYNILYEVYKMLVYEGYIGKIDEKMSLRNLINIIVDVLTDYTFNILSNYMEEDYYEYDGNIPYLNLQLIGKKSKPEINLKNLVFDILSDWSRGYQYNEKKELITNRNCNVNATVRL